MWTPKYENGCLIMLKYALEPLYAPEPLCDCLHQVVTRLLLSRPSISSSISGSDDSLQTEVSFYCVGLVIIPPKRGIFR